MFQELCLVLEVQISSWNKILEKADYKSNQLEYWRERRCNHSILKEISPEYSLEGLMLKLKLQYFGYLMWRTDLFEKTLMLGKIEGGGEGDDRGWDGWMASPTQWTWVWINSRSCWWTGKPGVLQPMGSQRIGHDCGRTESIIWNMVITEVMKEITWL